MTNPENMGDPATMDREHYLRVLEALRRLERKGLIVSSLCADGQVRWRAVEMDERLREAKLEQMVIRSSLSS